MSDTSAATDREHVNGMAAPAAEQFAAYPASWYPFCTERALCRGPLTLSLLGRGMVGFRTAGSKIAILDARCAHMNADLGRGRVVGEALQCPFHHWEYGTDGRCRKIPAQADIPAFARQRTYPVDVRHGSVYVFNGLEPLFPQPFLSDCRPEDFAAGRPLHFLAECSWYMLAANLFDVQHWHTQHHRQVLTPPVIDSPHPFARRIRFEARVSGSSIFDAILRRFAGETVQVSITCWGGNYFFATGFFRRVRSYIQVVTTPLDPNRVRVHALVFVRRGGLARSLVQPLSLWLRRLFTRAFMQSEFVQLAGIRYSPRTLVDSDREVREFLHWAAALPSSVGSREIIQGNEPLTPRCP
jgi:nitrite reductase/ring-hydroxylating ferredoxin subunit